MVAVTSSPTRAERLDALGAASVVVRRAGFAWHSEVLERTEGRGRSRGRCVGPVTLEQSVLATAFDGQLALMGVFSDATARFDPGILAGRQLSLRRIAVGSRAAFEAMDRAIAHDRIEPVVDRVFDFGHAPDAYRHLDGGTAFGKVVVDHGAGAG